MSQYKCKLVPLNSLPVGPTGVFQPLCNTCETKDCLNPIEPVMITLFGKQVQWKIYKKSVNSSIVISCTGYSKD